MYIHIVYKYINHVFLGSADFGADLCCVMLKNIDQRVGSVELGTDSIINEYLKLYLNYRKHEHG